MDDARLMASFGIGIFAANARNDDWGFRVIKYPLLVRRAHGAFRDKLNNDGIRLRSRCGDVGVCVGFHCMERSGISTSLHEMLGAYAT